MLQSVGRTAHYNNLKVVDYVSESIAQLINVIIEHNDSLAVLVELRDKYAPSLINVDLLNYIDIYRNKLNELKKLPHVAECTVRSKLHNASEEHRLAKSNGRSTSHKSHKSRKSSTSSASHTSRTTHTSSTSHSSRSHSRSYSRFDTSESDSDSSNGSDSDSSRSTSKRSSGKDTNSRVHKDKHLTKAKRCDIIAKSKSVKDAVDAVVTDAIRTNRLYSRDKSSSMVYGDKPSTVVYEDAHKANGKGGDVIVYDGHSTSASESDGEKDTDPQDKFSAMLDMFSTDIQLMELMNERRAKLEQAQALEEAERNKRKKSAQPVEEIEVIEVIEEEEDGCDNADNADAPSNVVDTGTTLCEDKSSQSADTAHKHILNKDNADAENEDSTDSDEDGADDADIADSDSDTATSGGADTIEEIEAIVFDKPLPVPKKTTKKATVASLNSTVQSLNFNNPPPVYNALFKLKNDEKAKFLEETYLKAKSRIITAYGEQVEGFDELVSKEADKLIKLYIDTH